MTETVLLARQPIFDRDLKIYGYELLFRNSDAEYACQNGDSATSQVLINAFSHLPMDELLEGKKAFVNFTETLLLQPPLFDQRQLVIEILETITVSDKLEQALFNLRTQGYTIALDDYVFNSPLQPLLPQADIIKVDVLEVGNDKLPEIVKQLNASPGRLLAEKIEDYDTLELCRSLGFDYFQGFFLSKPENLSTNKKLEESQKSVIELLAALHKPDVEIEEVVTPISLDPALSFKLLKIINSPLFALRAKIESIQHAVTLLGLDRLRSWATLLTLANSSNKPLALNNLTLARARLCQLLGEKLTASNQGPTFFTTGLFSSIDAYLDAPISNILESLNLSPSITQAILNYEGELGLALQTTLSFEAAEWDQIDWQTLAKFDIDQRWLSENYLDTLLWTQNVLKNIY